MTSNHHAPYVWASRMLQWPYKGLRCRKAERIPKSRSQFGWSATRPHEVESLVIADQQRCGEYVPRGHTARQVMRKSVTPEAGGLTLVEGAVEGGIGD